jgi:hypothetical protein
LRTKQAAATNMGLWQVGLTEVIEHCEFYCAFVLADRNLLNIGK